MLECNKLDLLVYVNLKWLKCILDLDKFVLYRNNYNNLGLMWIVNEYMFLCVVCFVDGNLILKICLFKGYKELVMVMNKLKWVNYFVIYCEDMDNYMCEGSFDEFSLNN